MYRIYNKQKYNVGLISSGQRTWCLAQTQLGGSVKTMTNKSEESLVEEARRCDNCLCWLQHCEAECCNQFGFRLNPQSDVLYLQDVVRIRIRITPDLKAYLELHGIKLEEDVVVIPKDNCDISTGQILVTMRCTALQDDFLCRLHAHGKPDYCKNLTWETAQEERCRITPKCLFAYKLKALSVCDTGGADC